MARRATLIDLGTHSFINAGEPILDTDEGVLIIQFDDGTSRTYNWDKVVSFYEMTEDEYEQMKREEEGDD